MDIEKQQPQVHGGHPILAPNPFVEIREPHFAKRTANLGPLYCGGLGKPIRVSPAFPPPCSPTIQPQVAPSQPVDYQSQSNPVVPGRSKRKFTTQNPKLLCRNHRKPKKSSKSTRAFRLPLRHEVGDLSCLGSNERNPPKAEAREGRASGSEASHWAGVRASVNSFCSRVSLHRRRPQIFGDSSFYTRAHAFKCSADFQSAVSRIYNLRRVKMFGASGNFDALPNAIRRYGRLKICATKVSKTKIHFSRRTSVL